MFRLRIFTLLFLGLSASVCHAQGYGKYVGSVQTEWLDGDRKMRLLQPFSYVDPNGVTWTAPAGWVIDGASIPVFAWSVIGGPFQGKYRDASVIHDVACDQKLHPWENVHEAFYWAMMASGVEPWRAKVMYAAVYHFGPRWPRLVTVTVPKNQVPDASQRALQNAEPGSNATIVRVRPEAGPGAPGVPAPAGAEKVDVQIQPPPQRLNERDFEQLRDQIIEKEAAAQNTPAPAPPSPAAEEQAKPRSRNFQAPGAGGGGATAPRTRSFSNGPNPALSLQDIRTFKAN